MKQEIKYRGFTAQPSDYECPDGDLASSFNLVHEDGSLRPIAQPAQLFQLNSGEEIIFIHATAVFKHYIILDSDNTLSWIDASDNTYTSHIIYDQQSTPQPVVIPTFQKINAVGNTLCVLCGEPSGGSNDGIHYFLWKAVDESYLYLGTKPPQVDLSFSTSDNKNELYDGAKNEKFFDYIQIEHTEIVDNYLSNSDGRIDGNKIILKEDYKKEINEAVWALINRDYAKISEVGHFYAPFYVRYCYRMYDDSLYMHSAPIFIPVALPFAHTVYLAGARYEPNQSFPNNPIKYGVVKYVHIDDNTYNRINTSNKTTFINIPTSVALTYKCSESSINLLEQWKDIVKSIDIFVSLPVMSEDSEDYIKTVSLLGNRIMFRDGLKQNETHVLYKEDTQYICDFIFDIPRLNEKEYTKKICEVGNFYKIHSFDLGAIYERSIGDPDNPEMVFNQYTELPIKKNTLSTLATREVMKDDYKTHNSLLPAFDDSGVCISSIYHYNNRLNVAGVAERLFRGFKMNTLVPDAKMHPPYQNGGVDYTNEVCCSVYNIEVYLDTDDGERKVLLKDSYFLSPYFFFNHPLFYPDNRAKKMVIYYTKYNDPTPLTPTIYKVELPMKSCPLINGAFTVFTISIPMTTWTNMFSSSHETTAPDGQQMADGTNKNKIYTSEVNNPFFFPVDNIKTIGTGIIIGLAATTKPLSQGQFGQHPLYAFCSDGVWALSVKSDGTLYPAQPATLDVCNNPRSITQLDNSVLFASDRGIMQLSGSTADCISDFLNEENHFNPLTSLPQLNQLSQLSSFTFHLSPFTSFLQGCRLLYDYTHQRIILFNPQKEYTSRTDWHMKYPYAYVYSLKSKLWGLMLSDLSYTINSYPDALAVDTNNYLVSFSQSTALSSSDTQLLVTRPIKLGDAGTLKSVHTILQRGYFRGRHFSNDSFDNGEVKTLLYGSNDLFTWHLVASSVTNELRGMRGTAYKYFRIVAVTNLDDGHSLSGVTIDFEPRHTHLIH